MSRAIDPDGFERKFAESDDPWECRSASSEALKRRRALSGLRLVGRALDVACGDGAGTSALAARAMRVDAVDGAASALASAKRLLAENRHVRFHHARAPDGLPRGAWQRILVSELVYYLAPHQIAALALALRRRLAAGGELITVHHIVSFDDSRTYPARAVRIFHAHLATRLRLASARRFGRYLVVRWRSSARAAPDGRRGSLPGRAARLQPSGGGRDRRG